MDDVFGSLLHYLEEPVLSTRFAYLLASNRAGSNKDKMHQDGRQSWDLQRGFHPVQFMVGSHIATAIQASPTLPTLFQTVVQSSEFPASGLEVPLRQHFWKAELPSANYNIK